MEIREAVKNDLKSLLELYTQLHGNKMPVIDDSVEKLWDKILADKNHHVIVLAEERKILSSCVLITALNLTQNQRPYALIENVITDGKCRNKGYGSAVMNFAGEIAVKENCYKIMLLTGSKEEETMKFYENLGYNRNDKTAFIQWLNI